MLTSIRNAIRARKNELTVPYAKMKWHLLQLFQELELISHVQVDKEKKNITITLAETVSDVKFENLKRLSKPGRRLYVGWKEIPRASRNGIIVISTSQGVMSGHAARQRHLGGELICEIS